MVIIGFIPSVKYGAFVTGVTDSALAGWRSLAAAAYGSYSGRSITARLALEQADPGRDAVTGPIMDWIMAWWDDSMDKEVMHDAWRFAIKSVGMSGRPNAAVRGGAGAFFAALRRLHWQPPSVHPIKTRDGTLLFFGEERTPEGAIAADPRTICRWARDDYAIVFGLNSQVARDISDIGGARSYARAKEEAARAEDGSRKAYGATDEEARLGMSWRRARYEMEGDILVPWFWPITRTLQIARRRGHRAAAASVRALVEGGWWVQRRLYAAGLAREDTCRCGEASGTLWHKLGRCKLTEEARQTFNEPGLFRLARGSVWDPLFSRGVPARPKIPKHPTERDWWRAEKIGEVRCASGDVYTDGAAEGGFFRVVRAGWGAVAISDEGVVLWSAGGVLGDPQASIFRAELKAVLAVLRIAVPPLRIHVDNAQVVRGFQQGKQWCVNSRSCGADIWREVWEVYDEIGGGVEVRKVKAHTFWWDVLAGKITARNRAGNHLAAQEAKKALHEAKREAPTGSFNAHLARAALWNRWLVKYATASYRTP